MSALHTPGPWRVSGKATINAGRGWIASVSTFNRDANARLISAAPDLFAALQGVMDILGRAESNASGNPEWDYVGPRVAAARAAIAKAVQP